MEGSTTRARGSASASGAGASANAGKPTVGSRIEVYWEKEEKYYAGVVKSFHRSTGKYLIKYDDGVRECAIVMRSRRRVTDPVAMRTTTTTNLARKDRTRSG